MATLDILVAQQKLDRIEVVLDGASQPWRCLYGLSAPGPNSFGAWSQKLLPTMQTRANADLTPEEQVGALLELFVLGEPLIIEAMYRDLHPYDRGVWELKTLDVRIFGWFPKRDHFIAVYGDDATSIHQHGLHHGYINEVARLRDLLDLDAPKFIPGGNPHAVLSNRS